MKTIHLFKSSRLIHATALSVSLSLGSSAFALGPMEHSYIIDINSRKATDLGSLGGDTYATALNDAGQVVGWSMTINPTSTYPHAFITGPNGVGMTDLGTLGGGGSSAYGINASGQVVGDSSGPSFRSHAFITGPNGVGMRDLGISSDSGSTAYGINATGQVTGTVDYIRSFFHFDLGSTYDKGFVTGPNGTGITYIENPILLETRAAGINASGQVTGWTSDSRSFITGPNGEGMFYIVGKAVGINTIGQATGTLNFENPRGGASHAFITGPNGAIDIGALAGGNSFASGINDAGQVVGHSTTAMGDTHAFVTGPNGVGMTDLNSLSLPNGVVLTEAMAINNRGQVVAISTIPEPASYALMLAGLGLVGFMVRRRKAGGAERLAQPCL